MIGCGCTCLLNGALENDTDLPKILLVWATPLCNLVCSLSESVELSVDFVRDAWVSSTWQFFGGGRLDGSWIGLVVFTLWLMFTGVEIGSENQKELIWWSKVGMMTLGVWGLSRGECQMRLLFSSRAPAKILSA